MRAAALAVAVVAAFVGVMYLRFSGDSVPGPPSGDAVGGPQCVVFRNVANGDEDQPQRTCGTIGSLETPPAEPPHVAQNALPSVAPPDSIGGVKVRPLEMGTSIGIPDNVALIVQRCLGECGDTQGLVRVYRDSQGQTRTDALVELKTLGLSPRSSSNPTGAYFTGFAASPDGSALALSVCVRGSCKVTSDAPNPESESAVFRSLDGGVTWSESYRDASVSWLAGISAEKQPVLAGYRDYTGQTARVAFWTVPGGVELEPPSATGYTNPFWSPDGGLFWHKDDGTAVVRADGTPWLGGWADPHQISLAWQYDFYGSGERALVSGTSAAQVGVGSSLLYVVRRDGSLEHVLATPAYVPRGVWLDLTHIIANLPSAASRPPTKPGDQLVTIDLSSRIIHPIRDPVLDQAFSNGGSVIALQRGPFARVVNTDNTCLNVHSVPRLDAPILECAAEGVLLRPGIGTADYPNVVEVDGTKWWSVITPSGGDGFASEPYLER